MVVLQAQGQVVVEKLLKQKQKNRGRILIDTPSFIFLFLLDC